MELLLKQQPSQGRAIYVDMNSFFASVEQEIKPALRGKPVGVCPFIHDATCVIAASIEAKRMGVTTGTLVRKARQRCPGIILISDDPAIYREYHRRIMKTLATTRCQVIIKSIDEAFLVVPRDLRGQAMQLAQQIRSLIAEVGTNLGCSIGVASNMFLAKMGTKLYKPRGLIQIENQDLGAFYATLQLTDLYGVSWRLAERLEAIGIKNPVEFYEAPYQLLKAALGVNGERWYLRLRGYEVDQQAAVRHTIGHQTTITPNPATTHKELLTTTSQLCYKTGVRLRAAGLGARSVQVGLRFTNRSYATRIRHTHSPFWDSTTLYAHAEAMIKQWPIRQPVRLVAVTCSGLMPQNAMTTPLLYDAHKAERLSRALDSIDDRFGRPTISPASHLLGPRMADRVGFGNAGQTATEYV